MLTGRMPAVRHEVIARSAYRRASLVISLNKWRVRMRGIRYCSVLMLTAAV